MLDEAFRVRGETIQRQADLRRRAHGRARRLRAGRHHAARRRGPRLAVAQRRMRPLRRFIACRPAARRGPDHRLRHALRGTRQPAQGGRRRPPRPPPRLRLHRDLLARSSSATWKTCRWPTSATASCPRRPAAGAARRRPRGDRGVVAAGALPFMLGGDHTATVPVIEALAPAFPDLRILQLDAHPDTARGVPRRALQLRLGHGAGDGHRRRRARLPGRHADGRARGVRAAAAALLPGCSPATRSTSCARLLPELRAPSALRHHRRRRARSERGAGHRLAGARRAAGARADRDRPACSAAAGSSAATSSRSRTPGIRRGRTGIAASWVIREALLTWWGDAAMRRACRRDSAREREYTRAAPLRDRLRHEPQGRGRLPRPLLQALRPAPVRRVLDIACGTGPHLIRLAERGYRMSGLDLSRGTSSSWASGWPTRGTRASWSSAT